MKKENLLTFILLSFFFNINSLPLPEQLYTSGYLSLINQALLFLPLTFVALSNGRSSLRREVLPLVTYIAGVLVWSTISIFWSISTYETLKFSLMLVLIFLFCLQFDQDMKNVYARCCIGLGIGVLVVFWTQIIVNIGKFSDDPALLLTLSPLVPMIILACVVVPGVFSTSARLLLFFSALGYLYLLPSKSYFIAGISASISARIWVLEGSHRALVIGTSLILLLAVVVGTDNTISQTFFYKTDMERSLSNLNTSGRLNTWSFIIEQVNKPIGGVFLGLGAGTSDYLMTTRYFQGSSVHSEYIKIYSELGFIGLLMVYLPIISIFIGARRCRRKVSSLLCSNANSVFAACCLIYIVSGVTYAVSDDVLGLASLAALSLYCRNKEIVRQDMPESTSGVSPQ